MANIPLQLGPEFVSFFMFPEPNFSEPGPLKSEEARPPNMAGEEPSTTTWDLESLNQALPALNPALATDQSTGKSAHDICAQCMAKGCSRLGPHMSR